VSGRRPRVVLALGLLLWIAAVARAVVPLLDEQVDGGPLEARPLPATICHGPEIGVNSTLAFESGAERRGATVAAIDETLGAQVVRDSLLWNRVEAVPDEFNWSSPDGVVEDLTQAGIEPLLVIVGSPPWANGVPESTPDQYLYVPPRGPEFDAWLDQYSQFVAAAVRRYKGVVRRWEIWNEPNLAVFWHPEPDPVAYREVYERLRATILRVDARAQVAVGGLGRLASASRPDYSALAFLRHLRSAKSPLDYVALHSYPTDQHAPDVHVPGELNFDDIERVHDKLVAEGDRVSIWVTEWGWSSDVLGESLQARYVDKSLAMIQNRYRFVRVATYFVDRDRPPEFYYGLLDESLEPKAAALAFRRHADLATSRCERSDGGSKPPPGGSAAPP
jgi:polysaccharide biosynthesis protein PslG